MYDERATLSVILLQMTLFILMHGMLKRNKLVMSFVMHRNCSLIVPSVKPLFSKFCKGRLGKNKGNVLFMDSFLSQHQRTVRSSCCRESLCISAGGDRKRGTKRRI